MPATHAQIARNLLVGLPDGVFAHAARESVIHGSDVLLERMFPGMKFANRKVGQDGWELVGTATDGSVIVWRVGG